MASRVIGMESWSLNVYVSSRCSFSRPVPIKQSNVGQCFDSRTVSVRYGSWLKHPLLSWCRSSHTKSLSSIWTMERLKGLCIPSLNQRGLMTWYISMDTALFLQATVQLNRSLHFVRYLMLNPPPSRYRMLASQAMRMYSRLGRWGQKMLLRHATHILI